MNQTTPIRQVTVLGNHQVPDCDLSITPDGNGVTTANGNIVAIFKDMANGVMVGNRITTVIRVKAVKKSSSKGPSQTLLLQTDVLDANLICEHYGHLEPIEYSLDHEDIEVLEKAMSKAIDSFGGELSEDITVPNDRELDDACSAAECEVELTHYDDYDFACRLSNTVEAELTVFINKEKKGKVKFDASFKEKSQRAKYVGRLMIAERTSSLTDISLNDLQIGSDIEFDERHVDLDESLYQFTPTAAERRSIINKITGMIGGF